MNTELRVEKSQPLNLIKFFHVQVSSISIKANLHWEVARSSRARSFVCFIAPRSCRAEPCTSAELPDATKQTKDYAWQLLVRPQCRLAFSVYL